MSKFTDENIEVTFDNGIALEVNIGVPESVAQQETLEEVKDRVLLTSLEKSLEDGVNAILTAIDDIEITGGGGGGGSIDTTDLAKQDTLLEVKTAVGGVATDSASILSAVNGIATSMYKGVPIVSQEGNATISPNTYNVWGEESTLTITKGAEIGGILNHYMMRFTLTGDAPSVDINWDGKELKWYGGNEPTWTSGKTYEVSIVDNIALWAEV